MNSISLSKEQLKLLLKPEPFALLREAKRKISAELSKDLALHSKEILDDILAFSTESKDERLFEIYSSLRKYIEVNAPAVPTNNEQAAQKNEQAATPTNEQAAPKNESKPISEVTNASTNTKSAKINIGDIVDGKRCTGFYRGQPVFSD